MGYRLLDQYTYLHFSVGVVAYFWNIPLFWWFIIHSIFELAENTSFGIYFINHYLTIWPGGKPKHDSYLNILGDTFGTILGWFSAYMLDKQGTALKWYFPHIQ